MGGGELGHEAALLTGDIDVFLCAHFKICAKPVQLAGNVGTASLQRVFKELFIL